MCYCSRVLSIGSLCCRNTALRQHGGAGYLICTMLVQDFDCRWLRVWKRRCQSADDVLGCASVLDISADLLPFRYHSCSGRGYLCPKKGVGCLERHTFSYTSTFSSTIEGCRFLMVFFVIARRHVITSRSTKWL